MKQQVNINLRNGNKLFYLEHFYNNLRLLVLTNYFYTSPINPFHFTENVEYILVNIGMIERSKLLYRAYKWKMIISALRY